MPPEQRLSDRPPVHYTMKTSRSAQSPSYRSATSSTPLASPRMPHSVGQPFPPKQSSSTGRASSPNYFGLAVEAPTESRDSSALPRENWSPPTSSVRSFAGALPKQLPLDANPEFEAFRRQIDANRGGGFALGSSHLSRHVPGTPREAPSLLRPKVPRWHTHSSDTGNEAKVLRLEAQTSVKSRDTNSLHDSAYASADSKRSSQPSLPPIPQFNMQMPRRESPAQIPATSSSSGHPNSSLSQVEDRHPRLSLSQGRTESPTQDAGHAKARARTLPPTGPVSGPAMVTPEQLRQLIEEPGEGKLLLLDLRVSTQYAQSRIRGAMNLCIPTTLLKRATFNLEKLQQTFQSDEEQEKFAAWRSTNNLVVYDASSSENRDAVAATNMLRKFTSEGYTGHAFVLRGGFNGFAVSCPKLIDHRPASELSGSPTLSLSPDRKRPTIAPVIGGVALPAAGKGPANPFFANIRQNMDLADGVGQMAVSLPSGIEPKALPRWLREAADPSDRGKRVADRFLRIELDEQSRMRHAYGAFGSGPATGGHERIQLSGIEKGSKNRYKDILPFEHARVHLQDKEDDACDYVNASHIKASRSNKRYIASQGPLPATFEDFWSVIWDQNVRVVVMLTAESEGGQLKCHPYWTGREFGPMKLRALSEKKVSLDVTAHRSHPRDTDQGRRRANTTMTAPEHATPGLQSSGNPQNEAPFVIIRKFALTHASHPFAQMREITHLHYPSWPDFGAPAQPSHLLALVELANVMQRTTSPHDETGGGLSRRRSDTIPLSWQEEPEEDPHARPMLVHCSAGCGRTGTFCTVDTVLDMLKRQRQRAVARAEAAASQSRSKIDQEGDHAMGDHQTGEEEELPPLESGMEWVEDDTMDLISTTVEDFRRQRLSMVQSLRQFVLCYETVTEWVWRLQDRSGPGGRARSGSLQMERRPS